MIIREIQAPGNYRDLMCRPRDLITGHKSETLLVLLGIYGIWLFLHVKTL